jgi:myo-inositol catabolism protein IolC
MKSIGYDKPLYLLPFDHRESFASKMFGWSGALTTEQVAEISSVKHVIYDGFKAAVLAGVPKLKAGILVDEQFGGAILRDARENGFTTACSVEKSGQEEFDFEYGSDFAAHIEAIEPTFCKVLVRYNPDGNLEMNRRQRDRLRILSNYIHTQSQSRFMFELLVPPDPLQLAMVNEDSKVYDEKIRPQLMVQTILNLQSCGIEPDVWKIEGLDRRDDCACIVEAARRNGRGHVGCIVLGRGENSGKVRHWLQTAASVEGFIGFAVGRTDFWDPLLKYRNKSSSREDAIAEISRRFVDYASIFDKSIPRITSHEQGI